MCKITQPLVQSCNAVYTQSCYNQLIRVIAKMADEVWEEIASVLSTIVTTTDKSGNLKKAENRHCRNGEYT